MTFIPKPHEIYKHFKGNLYQIVTIAEHTETGEKLVIYQALYGEFKTFARPLSMFTSEVDHVKYPEVTQRFRFELQGAEADRQLKETGTGEVAAWAVSESKIAQTVTAPVQETAVPVQKEPETLEEEEPALDPLVLEFLDADSYEQKLNILAGLHHRITNEMITTMAISCDIEVNDGELEERYEELKNCLLTMEKFECNRLR